MNVSDGDSDKNKSDKYWKENRLVFEKKLFEINF